MTVAELSALVRGLAPSLRDFVLSAQKSLSDRVFALETQDVIPGQDGEPGPPGAKGTDGKDGLGFEDLDGVYDECGRLSLRIMRGDVVKTFRVPGMVDRGVYNAGDSYLKGDGVTLGGSFWIAQSDTNARPGTPDGAKSWRLAVKVGRDGKEGKSGPSGPAGPRGEKGTDGRNGY